MDRGYFLVAFVSLCLAIAANGQGKAWLLQDIAPLRTNFLCVANWVDNLQQAINEGLQLGYVSNTSNVQSVDVSGCTID